ncbi:Protein-export membrane protein SecG [Planctomycetales bacterium 10988]|nr:Protein-export membrane protein SecG [Planctomycetales bacterium 10988]
MFFLMFLMGSSALLLILIILVQKGKGGGLTGAFGGAGSQSAFGAKAGDVFTKITVGLASFWIFTCMLTVWILNQGDEVVQVDEPTITQGTGAGAGSSEDVPPMNPDGSANTSEEESSDDTSSDDSSADDSETSSESTDASSEEASE